ncbi:MAG: hypothetical protein JSW34_03095 [Candidatus Zixiibacteriota bacterium]|nr:MAG: hypothetical protein JSW34_03095 [candidate division Zixibacteria bacterium]
MLAAGTGAYGSTRFIDLIFEREIR